MNGLQATLRAMLRAEPKAIEASTLHAFWPQRPSRGGELAPVDAAIVDGLAADRVAFAFAAGYHAALRALVPSLDADAVAALCATEEGGAHPKAIRARVHHDRLDGEKRWVTLADAARTLLVLATLGVDEGGKQRLKLVRVDRDRAGISVEIMPPTPFAPEVRHAIVRFEAVHVTPDDLLEGDGWNDFVKPFRTVEDLHVHAALLGHLVGVARRASWPHPSIEALVASAVVVRALALLDPRAPEVHVATAGALETSRGVLESCAPHWSLVDDAVRSRWERDRPLLEIASKARALRREAAWSALK